MAAAGPETRPDTATLPGPLLAATAAFVAGWSILLAALVGTCCATTPSLWWLQLVGAACIVVISSRLTGRGRNTRGGRARPLPRPLYRRLLLVNGAAAVAGALAATLALASGLVGFWPVAVAGALLSVGAFIWRTQLPAPGSQAPPPPAPGPDPAAPPDDGAEPDWPTLDQALTWPAPPAPEAEAGTDAGAPDHKENPADDRAEQPRG